MVRGMVLGLALVPALLGGAVRAASPGTAGADVRRWRSGARFGEEGDRLGVELAHWADEVDLAVVGLAN